jgi:signal transduction histidine kinase
MRAVRSVFGSVRPVDAVVAGVLTVLAVLLMQMQVGMDVGVPVEGITVDASTAWLHLFVIAPLAVLWWRRSVIAVIVLAIVVVLLHTLLFGHVVRCGAGLPLAFVVSFLGGYQYDRARAWWALGAAQVLTLAVLLEDAAAGIDLFPVVAVMCAAGWAVGQLARRRSALATELRIRNGELRALRDQRATLEVTVDRARLSGELESLLDRRLGQLTTLAEAGTRMQDPAAATALLGRIEDEGRRTLEAMRDVVGRLRGDELALAPGPSVAHLDALVAQHGARLDVSGDPRALPASVELSAYRVVEHLLTILDAGRPASPVAVRLAFDNGALEVHVTGRVSRGADVRDAIARARERARLQHGTLNVKVTRGHALMVAQFPVAA